MDSCDNSNSFIFQAIDWRLKQIKDGEDDTEETIIQVFGRTKNNETVYIEIKNFVFSFYIKKVDDYKKSLKYYLYKEEYKKQIYIDKNFKRLKDFYYFNGEKNEDFIKVNSKNYNLLSNFGYYVNDDKKKKPKDIINFQTYNKGKDAFIQFYHEKNIKPCGWIKIENYKKLSSNLTF